MKNKRILFFLISLFIVVGIVVFFILRTQQEEELLPQTFAEMPEKPKLIANFRHGATVAPEIGNPEDLSSRDAARIYSVAISPKDPGLIASVNAIGTIKFWKTDKTEEPVRILGHPGIFPTIGFSPTGKLLVSTGFGNLVMWDVASGMEINTLKALNRQFAFSPDGHQLATMSNKSKESRKTEVKIWDIQNPKKIIEIATLPFDETHRVSGWPCAVDISSDGKWIAAGYSNGTIDVWDLQNQQLVKTLETSFHNMDYIKFCPNKRYMVAGGRAPKEYSYSSTKWYNMWELPSWQRKGEVFRGNVEDLAFSPDGKMCVMANGWPGYGRGIEIWSTANGEPIASLPTDSRVVGQSQDGTLLATGNNDGNVKVWQLEQSQLDSTKIRNDVVRLVYYLPKDKKPTPNITQKLDKMIRKVQKFYADEMERHGFGRKTFTFETDENGKAKIYAMNENQIDNYHLQLNNVWLFFVDKSEHFQSAILDRTTQAANNPGMFSTELSSYLYDETFTYPTSKRTIVKDKIWMDYIKGSVGSSSYLFTKKKGFEWRLTAYELKHLFAGLDKKHRSDVYDRNKFKRFFLNVHRKMSWGKGWARLSRCEAEWLDKSRFFNPSQSYFDKRPKIEMNVSNEKTRSQLFEFTASDEDGIHQLQLFVPKDTEKEYQGNILHRCQVLNGKKKATVKFEISDRNIKRGEIRMIDMLGNIAFREFRIIEKTAEPDKE